MTEGDGVRAIVLGAGRGTRLWPLTKHSPKILLDLGDGTSLLDRHMVTLTEAGCIAAATVVTGHLAAKVERRIGDRWREVADSVFNPFYAEYGPLGSLWCVRDQMVAGDFVVFNGDTLYSPDMVRRIVSAAAEGTGAVLAISVVPQGHEDDVRVWLEGERIVGVGKDLKRSGYRSAGLLAIRGAETRKRFVSMLEEMMREAENVAPSAPWHDLVNRLVAEGVQVGAAMVEDAEWTEVDLHPDLSLVQALVAQKLP